MIIINNQQQNICVNCMTPLRGASVCFACQFNNSNLEIQDERALWPNTLLQGGRYILGRIVTINGEGFTYIGFDKKERQKVLVREFFPDTIAYRDNNSNNVMVDNRDNFQYKTLKIDFFDLQTELLNFSDISGIIPVIYVFEENNTAYSVMEYIESITLEDFLTQIGGSLNYQEAGAIFEPFFETILNLHLNNVIHRGISAETIVIDTQGNLRLSGFSITAARTSGSEISSELFDGFSAPEQYDMSQWQGTWTDVYSASAVMYRVITGVKPQPALERKANDRLLPATKINSNIPKNVSYGLHQGMIVNLEHRTESMDEIINTLFYGGEVSPVQGGSTRRVDLDVAQNPTDYRKNKPIKRKTKKSALPYTIASAFITTVILLAFMSFLIKAVDAGTPKIRDDTNSTIEETSSSQEETAAEYYEMPNFVNSYVSRANSDKGANTYFVLKITTKNDEFKPKDIVIEQDVAPGTRINKGDTPIEVNLVVSKGKQELPDMKDYPVEDVQKILQEKEIPYETFFAFHDEIKEGNVIRVDRGGALASIIVSKGKESGRISDPNDPYSERDRDKDGVPIGPLIGDNR